MMEALKDELYSIFEKYKTDVFIETGTFQGHSVARVLAIGYKAICSCEINHERYMDCLDKFHRDEAVRLYYGDSLHALPLILADLDTKATFWLDAHMSGISRNCPTLEELKIIGRHHVKDHIILIDDMVDFGTQAHEWISIEDLKNQILQINPDYKFSFESTSKSNNVLVCRI